MIVKQIISRLTRRSGHSWSQCSKEPRRAGTTSTWSHLGSGPLLKKKVRFVFHFEQWRKSRIQESKLLELEGPTGAGVGGLGFVRSEVRAVFYHDILVLFRLDSADQLFRDAAFIYWQDSTPALTANSSRTQFKIHLSLCWT